jgi:hypothetical protein
MCGQSIRSLSFHPFLFPHCVDKGGTNSFCADSCQRHYFTKSENVGRVQKKASFNKEPAFFSFSRGSFNDSRNPSRDFRFQRGVAVASAPINFASGDRYVFECSQK